MTALWKVKPVMDAPSQGLWLGPGSGSPNEGLRLGGLAELVAGKTPQVWLTTGKEQVMAVVGKRGSGKSFTLGVIAEGLSLSSEAPLVARRTRTRGVILFDPLDVYWTTRLAVSPSSNPEAQRHYEMAQSANLTGLSFNVEAWVPGTGNLRPGDPPWFTGLDLPVSALSLEEWELLLEVNAVTDPMGQALTDSIRLAAVEGYRYNGRDVPPTRNFGLDSLIGALQSDALVAVYHVETLRALRQRLGGLQATGLFSPQGTQISDLIKPTRVSVILLGRLPQSYRAAVVAVITRLLVDARSRVAFAEKRLALDPSLTSDERALLGQLCTNGVPRTVVALDEAQVFLAPGKGNVAREVFVRLVKEGRNIGLSAILATQQPSALDRRVLSQVETFIAHQLVTEPDIQAVRENLKANLPDEIEFGKETLSIGGTLRMLGPGQCLVSAADMNSRVRRSVIVNVRPRATVHGGIEL